MSNGASGRDDDGRQQEREQDSKGSGTTITSELKDTFREAAIEVLKPVARKATTAAAKYAVTQGPQLVKDKVAPKLADAGGVGSLAKGVASKGGGIAETVGGVASKLTPGGGSKKEGKSPSGTGRGRRLPVEWSIDIGVDIETAYDQFTQFEDWPRFMHRVESIEQRDETTLMWHENVWGVRRSWEVEITEQIPCERLVWRSKNGPMTLGVATFHRISDNLTRLLITMDFQPQGLFEKAASGTRISRRALTSDMMRFKAFIELRDEATGEWKGRIEDGELADDEDRDEDEPQGREDDFDERDEDEEPEAREDEDEEEDEEPEAREDDDYEDEEDEEDEEEPEAREDEDYDDEEDEDDEERESRPRSRSSNARFKRRRDEEADDAPRPRRRRRAAASKG